MAQAKLRNLNTVVNKFYGGMSNDDYVGAGDASGAPMSFYDGSGVDIRSQAKFIQLAKNNATKTNMPDNYSTTGDVVALIQTGTSSQAICCAKGKVYSWTPSLVKTTTANIINAFTYNGTGNIIKANGKIDRWTLNTDADTGITAAYTADYGDLGVTVSVNSPYLIDSSFLYIGIGNKLYKADLSTVAYPTVLGLTIDTGFTITGITQIGDRFYIYANDGSNGMQYLWTGSSVLTGGNLSKIKWVDKPIINVANLNNVDYVITGNSKRRSLYRVVGFQPELLLQSKSQDNAYNYKFVFKPDAVNSIETVNNTIYIAADGCIYTWGHNISGMPDSTMREMTFFYTAPTVIQTDTFGQLNIYYFYNDGTNTIRATQYIGVDGSGTAYGLDPGTIIFNPIISSLYSNENSSLKVRIGYDLPNTNCKINLYRKLDYGTGYANFYVSTNSTTTPVVGDTYTYNSTTYTVYAVTKQDGNATNYIVHCTYTDTSNFLPELKDINKLGSKGTMTRASGTGPATFVFNRITDGMKLIGTISDITTHKQLFDVSDPNFQVTFMLDLITYNADYTPRVWDFVYAYQEIENDI